MLRVAGRGFGWRALQRANKKTCEFKRVFCATSETLQVGPLSTYLKYVTETLTVVLRPTGWGAEAFLESLRGPANGAEGFLDILQAHHRPG